MRNYRTFLFNLSFQFRMLLTLPTQLVIENFPLYFYLIHTVNKWSLIFWKGKVRENWRKLWIPKNVISIPRVYSWCIKWELLFYRILSNWIIYFMEANNTLEWCFYSECIIIREKLLRLHCESPVRERENIFHLWSWKQSVHARKYLF